MHRPHRLLLAVAALMSALASAGCDRSAEPSPSTTTMPSPPAAADTHDAHNTPDEPVHTNALANTTSPYLLQHAHNPVDWRPWGDEAFAEAREQGKPIFLSVGYSTCHWCHVMAHESFEHESVAAVLNEHFVSIKVDREELPDVDNQYMLATQAFYMLSGNPRAGGWPNSVWLLPDGRPFYAGTYFPREMFINLLERLAVLYRDEPDRVQANAEALTTAIKQLRDTGTDPTGRVSGAIDRRLITDAVMQARRMYDAEHGGFGGRPKFPPHANLSLLIDQIDRTGDESLKKMLTATLDAMRLGGVYDHVGGGFHRYATDERWFLPHFEKMLYDNAQLVRAYADGYRLTGHERYRRTVAEVFAWVEREMTDQAGGFYSALDADSEGEEGKFYVWSHAEMVDVLGEKNATEFAARYNATPTGNFHDESTGEPMPTNVLHLSAPLDDDARAKFAPMLEQLRKRRDGRTRPHLDDKVLTSWNALMIDALAYAGRVLDEPRYTKAALRAATFVLDTMREPNGQLLRTYRKGEAKLPAYLDDYAYLAAALLELHTTTGDVKWLGHAHELVDTMIGEFGEEAGATHGFYYTSFEHDALIPRTKRTGGGGNLPNPNGIAASALVRLSDAANEPRYRHLAAASLLYFDDMMRQNVFEAGELINAANDYLGAAGVDATTHEHPATTAAYISHDQAEAGGKVVVAVRVTIADGYHLYAAAPDDEKIIATKLALTGGNGVKLTGVSYSEPAKLADPVFGRELDVYRGEVWLLATLEVTTGGPFTLTLSAQACDDQACLAPQTQPIRLHVDVGNQAIEATRNTEPIAAALQAVE